MEKLLIEFINTLDLSLKKLQAEVGDGYGISKLTIHQFQYIDAIHELGEPTITEIADRLNITKASVTTGINKLISVGYVIKTQSNEDKRVFHVSLTDASNRLIKAKYQALKEYGEFIVAALSKDEARQFKATLNKLVILFKQAE
jgi:DNA-binding MarR family transcriptional regulator